MPEGNVFDNMRQAVQEAKTTLRAADSVATELAMMLEGRLRNVNSVSSLIQLKMTPDGRTVGEVAIPQIEESYKTGKQPQFLLTMGGTNNG